MDWFRMYTEARNDAKLRSLTDTQHRVWFNLLCFAAEQPKRGAIDGYDLELLSVEVAGGDVSLLSETFQRLQRLRIIEVDQDAITFVNFSKRQYEKPSDRPSATRERKRKQRNRDQNKEVSTVTPCHTTDTESDADTDTDSNTHTDSYLAAVVIKDDDGATDCINLTATYEQEFGRLISPSELRTLRKYALGCEGEELVCEAIRRTRAQGKTNIRYVTTILQNWKDQGIRNLAGVGLADQEFAHRKKTGQLKVQALPHRVPRAFASLGEYMKMEGGT